MISKVFWPNKRTDQKLDYGHDFSAQIGEASDGIDPTSVNAEVLDGDVVLSQELLAVDNSQEITVVVEGGTHQSLNRIKLSGTTIGGRRVSVIAILRVRDQ